MTYDVSKKWPARRPVIVGTITAIALAGSLGAWSVGTELAGAVIAPGVVQVEDDRQVVQHPNGGVVGEILVRDGDRVIGGDILFRLDGTFLKSELAVVEGQLVELLIRKRRLEAERDLATKLDTTGLPTFALVSAEEMERTILSQQRLLTSRQAAMGAELEQLVKQEEQTAQQIEGLNAELISANERLSIAEDERADREQLQSRGLSAIADVRNVRREIAQLQGEIGRLNASVAETKSRQSQIALEALRVKDGRQSEAILELRQLYGREIELAERQISLKEQYSRLDVRAPVSGRVFELAVQTVNSVIRAAEPVLYIVPEDRPLQVSARIRPADVDQVREGQDVRLVFSAFDRRTTPEVDGKIRFVAADTTTDERGNIFYEALVEPDYTSGGFTNSDQIVPGMPVEAFVVTEKRTPLEYLVKPLMVYFNRSFRES